MERKPTAGTDAHTKKTKGYAADYLVTPSFACALDNDGGFATSENAHAMVHTVLRSCKRQMSTARKRGCNGTHSHSTQHNNTQRTAQQHTAQQHTAHTSSLPSQSARTDPAATASAARATTAPAAASTRPSSGLPRRSTSHPNRSRAGQVKGNTRGERTKVGWLCACVRVCVCVCSRRTKERRDFMPSQQTNLLLHKHQVLCCWCQEARGECSRRLRSPSLLCLLVIQLTWLCRKGSWSFSIEWFESPTRKNIHTHDTHTHTCTHTCTHTRARTHARTHTPSLSACRLHLAAGGTRCWRARRRPGPAAPKRPTRPQLCCLQAKGKNSTKTSRKRHGQVK